MNPAGAAFVSEVELPREIFDRRAELDGERNAEAKANPGPVFVNLLQVIRKDKYEFIRDRGFIEQLAVHWLDHGWLSSKQVEKMSDIAASHAVFVEVAHYVGSSLDEWRKPFLEARRRRLEEEKKAEDEARSRARARFVAEEIERRERERIKAIALAANRQVKAVLKQMEQRGELDQLDLLVSAIFPHATLSPASRATTYVGSGSKELRVCIAAFAFGKAPALVWKESGVSQPGADSELWRAVTNHPAFLALGRPLHQEGT